MASRARVNAITHNLRVQLDQADAPPEALNFVQTMARNRQVDAANFVALVKSKMPELRATSKAHIVELMRLAFGLYTAMWMASHTALADPPAAPSPGWVQREPQWIYPFGASCDGKSVVEAVFASAEAKALARQH